MADPSTMTPEQLRAEVKRLRALCGSAAKELDGVWDEGPAGEGWQSKRLSTLVSDLRDAAEGEEVTHG
jgi:hypothetical protein